MAIAPFATAALFRQVCRGAKEETVMWDTGRVRVMSNGRIASGCVASVFPGRWKAFAGDESLALAHESFEPEVGNKWTGMGRDPIELVWTVELLDATEIIDFGRARERMICVKSDEAVKTAARQMGAGARKDSSRSQGLADFLKKTMADPDDPCRIISKSQVAQWACVKIECKGSPEARLCVGLIVLESTRLDAVLGEIRARTRNVPLSFSPLVFVSKDHLLSRPREVPEQVEWYERPLTIRLVDSSGARACDHDVWDERIKWPAPNAYRPKSLCE